MEKLTTTTHRRPNGAARRTIAAHVDEAAVIGVDLLVARGVFVNRSHAVDAAIALLLREYAHLLGREVSNLGESGERARRSLGGSCSQRRAAIGGAADSTGPGDVARMEVAVGPAVPPCVGRGA